MSDDYNIRVSFNSDTQDPDLQGNVLKSLKSLCSSIQALVSGSIQFTVSRALKPNADSVVAVFGAEEQRETILNCHPGSFGQLKPGTWKIIDAMEFWTLRKIKEFDWQHRKTELSKKVNGVTAEHISELKHLCYRFGWLSPEIYNSRLPEGMTDFTELFAAFTSNGSKISFDYVAECPSRSRIEISLPEDIESRLLTPVDADLVIRFPPSSLKPNITVPELFEKDGTDYIIQQKECLKCTRDRFKFILNCCLISEEEQRVLLSINNNRTAFENEKLVPIAGERGFGDLNQLIKSAKYFGFVIA